MINFLAIATAIAAIINAGAIIYDVRNRNKILKVSFVKVPNENPGGFRLFSTKDSGDGTPANSKKILIKQDRSVEIYLLNGTTTSFSTFFEWRS